MEDDGHLIIDAPVHVQFRAHARPVIILLLRGAVAPGPTPPLLGDVMTTLLHPVEGLSTALDRQGIPLVVEMIADRIPLITTIEMHLQMGKPSMSTRREEVGEIPQGDCQGHHLALGLDPLTGCRLEADDRWHDESIWYCWV